MAIYPTRESQTSVPSPGYQQPFNIEIWTEETTRAMGTLSFYSPGCTRHTGESLTIPLDEDSNSHHINAAGTSHHGDDLSASRPRREPFRRDSLKRREALLKGKEGSRRRQRWENDRLLNNPWAQPPLPSDWEVHPTYPKHTVPYYLAPLWDAKLAAKQAAENKRGEATRQRAQVKSAGEGKVPKELREKLKKAKAAKGLLQALEEEVRKFIKNWEERTRSSEEDITPEVDSEDEEIVFVGRNGQMLDLDMPSLTLRNENVIKDDQLVFDSAADDHGANFGRWLVHSIGSYYGLRTWSVTVGDPARREAYVGIKQTEVGRRPISPVQCGLPRPLWGMV